MINFITQNCLQLKRKENILYIHQKLLTKKPKERKKKRTIIDYIERKEGAYKNNKIKSIFYFDEEQSNSVKSLAIEGHGYI